MPKAKMDAIIMAVKAALNMDDRYTSLSVYLSEIKKNPSSNVFGSEEILSELVESILAAKSDRLPLDMIKDAEDIYRAVVPLGRDTKDYGVAKAVFLKLFEKNGIYFSGLFSKKIFLTFADRTLYIDAMCAVGDMPMALQKLAFIEDYAVEVRQFFTDEKRYMSALTGAAERICCAEDPSAEVSRLLGIARRAAGVYDISEESISRTELALQKAGHILDGARHTLDLTENRLDSIKSFTENSEKIIQNTTNDSVEKLRREAANAELELRKAYEAFLNEEHDNIIFEKDSMVREIVDSVDKKIREMRVIASSIKDSISADLYRVNTEANNAVDRAAAMLGSDELKNMIAEMQKSDELVERIIRVDEFSRNFDEEKITSAANAVQISAAAPTVGQSAVIVRENQCSEPADMTPNFFFDEKYPFRKRFDKLMEKKQQDISENGTLYHEHFNDILTAVMEDSNPYLIGPSGCGKTFLVRQIANLLELEYLDIGYINEEYDILGFQTADGGYSYPAFYKAYKYGGIVFCDEFDNGNIRAAVKLNSFMATGADASYCFPNGERVQRHPNFRIIAAGNTAGGGADRNYSTREKIEESLQQRFTAMYVDYDNRLEEQILIKYPDWFEFAVQFRHATDEWSRANELAAPGIFTTRDATSIKKYLDHESYGPEAIMSYEFVETKDAEYLAFLQREMSSYYKHNRTSSELFKIFSKAVDDVRSGEKRR